MRAAFGLDRVGYPSRLPCVFCLSATGAVWEAIFSSLGTGRALPKEGFALSKSLNGAALARVFTSLSWHVYLLLVRG